MSLAHARPDGRRRSVDLHPALQIDGVSKTFEVAGRRVEALQDISVSLDTGQVLAVVGASGCGKSTLLRLILGLDLDFEGEIRLDGNRVRGPGLNRGIVFQDHRLLPWLTVQDNIAAALRRSGLPKAERRELVAEHLALVGLGNFAQAWPAQLSGGMSQRVAIARALVNRPRFLLLDEPLGALDALTRLRLQDELARIISHEGSTVVLVTHDVDEAVLLADRIMVLHPNPGRMKQILDVERRGSRERSSLESLRLRDTVLEALGVRSHDGGRRSPGKSGGFVNDHAMPASTSRRGTQ